MSYIKDMRRAIRPHARWQKGHTMSNITTIRAALINEFGARQYRITRDGEIHVYGTMPNTNTVGWYLYGTIDSAETLARLGL